jgi:hypothetical protein
LPWFTESFFWQRLLCQNIVVIFLLSVFPDQGLNCFVLESSRVFFVKFPKLSLFQISEHRQVLCCAFELKVFEVWSRSNVREWMFYCALYCMLVL